MEDLQRQINELRQEINNLKNYTTIPNAVEQSLRTRLKIDSFAELATSTKTAGSETQAVDEGGTDTYSVAKPPKGFRQFIDAGTAYYIPYYEA